MFFYYPVIRAGIGYGFYISKISIPLLGNDIIGLQSPKRSTFLFDL